MGKDNERWYACKKCRTRLFQEKDIDPHSPGSGQDMFEWTKRQKQAKYNDFLNFFCINLVITNGLIIELHVLLIS